MKIKIRKRGLQIFVLKEENEVDKNQLNVTNILNFKEIIFEEKKLKEPFIQTFLKELFENEIIHEINLEYISFIPLILPIISSVPCIEKLTIKEDKSLAFNLYDSLKTLTYIKEISCYEMSDDLFFALNQKIKITFRKKEFIKSDFMITNNLTTQSNLFYKKSIVMYESFLDKDFEDFDTFLKKNETLEKIECYGHNKEWMKKIITSLLTNHKKKLKIIIYQQKEEQKELEELLHFIEHQFKRKLKKAHISVQLCYNKTYKEKYVLKQLNLTIFRIVLILLLMFTTSIYIISKFHKYHNEVTQKEVEKIIEKPVEENKLEENIPIAIPDQEKEPTEEKKDPPNPTYQKNFKQLKKINSEFVLWLTVPNTKVSYPVVKHKDNDYYLTHSFDKRYNIHGWIFMDYRNNINLTDQNTIIYGHDSDHNLMFGSLNQILNKNWYTKNKTITIEKENQKIKAEIISIYTILNTNDYLQVVFSDQEFKQFLTKITKRSIYNFHTSVNKKDKIITLSTCYKDSKRRLVLHGKIT